jgi:hypothetical protein
MQDDLPTVPDTVQYVCALTAIEKNISVRDRELLAAHWLFPKHAATASELAHATGEKVYGAVNLRYGRLGKRLRQEMSYTAVPEIESYVISSWKQRGTDGHLILNMHPQVAAALVQLGWVKRKEVGEIIDAPKPWMRCRV